MRTIMPFAIGTLAIWIFAWPIHAGELDPQQIKIIRDTADSICTTVREAKGHKTNAQIEGDVKAQLGGVLGKLADVGATGKGSVDRQEFEGLTQEATAIAFSDDRTCRQHIFDKMFDKLSSTNVPTSIHVAADPDTVGIKPGGLHVIAYRFTDIGASSVLIETQDAQWRLSDGTSVGENCIGCRILGGSFTVPAQGQYIFRDNVYLPPDLAQAMNGRGKQRVNLRTVFNGRDQAGTSVTATAVLTIVPVQ